MSLFIFHLFSSYLFYVIFSLLFYFSFAYFAYIYKCFQFIPNAKISINLIQCPTTGAPRAEGRRGIGGDDRGALGSSVGR